MRAELVLQDVVNDHREIALAVNDSNESLEALHAAAKLAREHRARLTIIFIVPAPWPFVALAGICPDRLRNDVIAEAAASLRQMAARLPPDVPVTTQLRCGRASMEVFTLLRDDRHDLALVALGQGGILLRIARRLEGSALPAFGVRVSPCTWRRESPHRSYRGATSQSRHACWRRRVV